MRLIKLKTIEQVAQRHPDASRPLSNWVAMVKAARWKNPDELVRSSSFPARTLGNGRVIFNIKGNDYRLICNVRYAREQAQGVVYVKWFGTHAEYDKVDAETIEMDFP